MRAVGAFRQTVAIDSVSVTHKNDKLHRCSQDAPQQVFWHLFFHFFFLHRFAHVFSLYFL